MTVAPQPCLVPCFAQCPPTPTGRSQSCVRRQVRNFTCVFHMLFMYQLMYRELFCLEGCPSTYLFHSLTVAKKNKYSINYQRTVPRLQQKCLHGQGHSLTHQRARLPSQHQPYLAWCPALHSALPLQPAVLSRACTKSRFEHMDVCATPRGVRRWLRIEGASFGASWVPCGQGRRGVAWEGGPPPAAWGLHLVSIHPLFPYIHICTYIVRASAWPCWALALLPHAL